MKIGIIIFAYNRNKHLQQVLNGLRKNKGVEQIYIFQDGLKKEEHRAGWEKTTEVIDNIDWCKVIFSKSDQNKGLKKTILEGVNKVFREYDAIIVLEDDCVVTSNFMDFMTQSLEKYQDDKKVYCVSGYAWPIEVTPTNEDAYFCGRISSWGWGTWKDRWNKLELDYEMLRYMKNDKGISEELDIWGNDLENILIENIRGNADSWATFWALSVIKHKGLCLNPYYSLVKNIGFDGSGVHCGNSVVKIAQLMNEEKKQFVLPSKLEAKNEVKNQFQLLFGGLFIEQEVKNRLSAVVYGMGNFYHKYEKRINEQFYLSSYIDQNKNGYYAGKRIGKISELNNVQYDVIIIMIANLNETIKVAKSLHNNFNVPYEKIYLGQSLFERDRTHINGFSSDGRLVINVEHNKFYVNSYDEYANSMEVFKHKIYDYCINNGKQDAVIDVGGSVGDSSLWFLFKNNVKKVYYYEPFASTFSMAQDNLKLFINSGRLEMNRYGISDKSENRTIMFNANMSCGQSTIAEARECARQTYDQLKLINENDEIRQNIIVKQASEVFSPLIGKHKHDNLILKMDCEGEEYGIIKDLYDTGLLSKFSFIMLEWHYKGNEELLRYLSNAGFSYWCSNKDENMGLIYAFKNS